MVLPDKHLRLHGSLLGAGAAVLSRLRRPATVSELWSQVEEEPGNLSFQGFILAMDFLYAIGAIELDEQGLLRRSS